jgi:hypothetical protein
MNLNVLSGEGLRFYGVAYGPGEVIPDVPEPVPINGSHPGSRKKSRSARVEERSQVEVSSRGR